MRAMDIEDPAERQRLHEDAVAIFNTKSGEAVELIRMDIGAD